MQSRREFSLSLAVSGLTAVVGLRAQAQMPARAVAATAITEVFGDGVRFVAIAIEYDAVIDGAQLSAADFPVEGRTVTGAYTASSADPADRATSGRYVVVTLSPDDAGASLVVQTQPQGGGQPGGGPGGPGGPGKAGSIPTYDTSYRTPEATVAGIATSAVKNLVVDDFQQLAFKDEVTGDTLAYNLFIPKDYDPSKAYPLVLFMHDAGATSDVTRTTLFQGLGAICWASPEDQAERPCFVLAPQYAEIIADDDSRTSSMLDSTIDLIKWLSQRYSIDTTRLYTTGQSGGCMMSIAMNIKYPDFFAASFLVAGQWDPSLVAPMAGNRLWILVSQDDDKAFPGENAITEALAAEGATISRAVWDGTWSAEQFRFAFDDLDAEGSRINYVTFAKGTVILPGQSAAGASGHRNTWRIAYTIEPIRAWIFRQ